MNFTSTKAIPMTQAEVKAVAPSVFAEHPWAEVSERYTFIPTLLVMEALNNEGWHVMKAAQNSVRLPDKKQFTRHVLRFRQEGISLAAGDVFPEIVLLNSHDRGSAYQMHAGLFRLVCSNGLIVDDTTFAKIRIRHSGNILDEVRYGAEAIMRETPAILENVNEMKTIDLTPNEQGVFAQAALSLRFDENIQIEPSRALVPKRYRDDAKDLWTTFNVIQENIIRGGLRYTSPAYRDEEGAFHPSRRARTREVKSIDTDTKLNKALWMLAEEMKKLKRQS